LCQKCKTLIKKDEKCKRRDRKECNKEKDKPQQH
jgi:hypothetical protein